MSACLVHESLQRTEALLQWLLGFCLPPGLSCPVPLFGRTGSIRKSHGGCAKRLPFCPNGGAPAHFQCCIKLWMALCLNTVLSKRSTESPLDLMGKFWHIVGLYLLCPWTESGPRGLKFHWYINENWRKSWRSKLCHYGLMSTDWLKQNIKVHFSNLVMLFHKVMGTDWGKKYQKSKAAQAKIFWLLACNIQPLWSVGVWQVIWLLWIRHMTARLHPPRWSDVERKRRSRSLWLRSSANDSQKKKKGASMKLSWELAAGC